MRKLIINTIKCLLSLGVASFLMVSCSDDTAELYPIENQIEISFNLPASADLSRTDVPGEDNLGENTLQRIDLLIYNTAGSLIHYQKYVSLNVNSSYTATLNRAKSDFTPGETYQVYAIANCPDTLNLQTKGATLSALKQVRYADVSIYKAGTSTSPKLFLMDGTTALIINNGTTAPCQIGIGLKRMAAKIRLNISCTDSYESSFNIRLQKILSYNLYNYAMNSYLTQDAPIITKPTLANVNTSVSLPDFQTGLNNGKTILVYTFANDWTDGSNLNNATYVIINMPYISLDNVSAGPINNYFKIPINFSRLPQASNPELNQLKRNYYYEVNAVVNKIGSQQLEAPIELTNVDYTISPWTIKDINIGGSDDPIKTARYLLLSQKEVRLNNVTQYQDIKYNASGKVIIDSLRIYYQNNMGSEQVIVSNSITTTSPSLLGFTDSVLVRLPGYVAPVDLKQGYVRFIKTSSSNEVTTDESGYLDILSYHLRLAGKNSLLVKKISFVVRLNDGQTPVLKQKVTISQFPAEYATNTQGWFSFKTPINNTSTTSTNWGTFWQVNSDFGMGKIGSVISQTSGYNGIISDVYFQSKVVKGYNVATGTSTLYNYGSWSNAAPNYYKKWLNGTSSNFTNLTNAHIYHVRISKQPSGNVILGYPQLTSDWTTSNTANNASTISPFFMIASQLGAVTTSNDPAAAFNHCKNYAEVTYKNSKFGGTIDTNGNYLVNGVYGSLNDWVVYGDWRLPTKAELEIIAQYQNAKGAVVPVLGGGYYWGLTNTNSAVAIPTGSGGTSSNAYIRCVRDVKPGDPNFDREY